MIHAEDYELWKRELLRSLPEAERERILRDRHEHDLRKFVAAINRGKREMMDYLENRK